jgi:hypothetical protein
MAADRDDDALSWGGDDDPTLDTAAPKSADIAATALPDGYAAVGKGSGDVGHVDADGTVTMPGEPEAMGNAALVSLGILGGIYLLWTIGWIVGGLRLQPIANFLVSPAGFLPAFWLAVIAPAIWFAVVVVATRSSVTWIRILWLVVGAILLVPWPFIMIGAVGA